MSAGRVGSPLEAEPARRRGRQAAPGHRLADRPDGPERAAGHGGAGAGGPEGGSRPLGSAAVRGLVAAMPFAGHAQPMAAVAAELVRRGHDVVAYTGAA